MHRPDSIIIAQVHDVLADLTAVFRNQEAHRLLQQVSVVALSQVIQGTGLSGIEENSSLMGEWAVELLIARITNRDFGIPTHPRIEVVKGRWVEGKSLRKLAG